MIPHDEVVICDRGRVCAFDSIFFDKCDIVETVTGAVLTRTGYTDLAVDTSGVLVWRGPDRNLMTGSGPDSDGRALQGLANGVRSFRYGIIVVDCSRHHCVLRFDGELASAVDPIRKGECSDGT